MAFEKPMAHAAKIVDQRKEAGLHDIQPDESNSAETSTV